MATTHLTRARSSSNLERSESQIRLSNTSNLVPSLTSSTSLLKKKRFFDRSTRKFRVKRHGKKVVLSSYIKTGYHGLIDMHWILFLIIIISFYLLSFTFYGLIYYAISETMGCIEHVSTWPDAFFFSVQTGMTIGYGSMYPEDCRTIIYAVTMQSLFGLITDALVLGLAFEKVRENETINRNIVDLIDFLFYKKACSSRTCCKRS